MSLAAVYARETPPRVYRSAIFLEGPTPKRGVRSWRADVLDMLRAVNYQGVVFIPEDRPNARGNARLKIDPERIEWGSSCRAMADVIVAWMPRALEGHEDSPDYELGENMDSGRMILGTDNPKLHYSAEKLQVPVASTLQITVQNALNVIGQGAKREGGERYVPLLVWRTEHFQQWYATLKHKAKNRLDYAKVVWTWRVGPGRSMTFFWILHVYIWIAAEGRHKKNEVVLSRPDISCIVLYRRAPVLDDSLVLVVKEFRSPCANSLGYVYENAGGSSWKAGVNPLVQATEECHEETGLTISPDRFVSLGARQVVPTLSTHKGHAYAVELTREEVDWLLTHSNVPRGVVEDTERTYALMATWGEIRQSNVVGWADVGMIAYALTTNQ